MTNPQDLILAREIFLDATEAQEFKELLPGLPSKLRAVVETLYETFVSVPNLRGLSEEDLQAFAHRVVETIQEDLSQ